MFELEYPDRASIPAEVRHLYSEVDGVFKILSAGSVKSKADTDRLQESLRKEREDHKETKSKVSAFGDLDADEVLAKLDRIEELEAAAGDKIDDAKINEMVETRMKSKIAPIQRELEKANKEKSELSAKVTEYSVTEQRRTIHDSVRKAAKAEHIRDTAVEDALMMSERIFEIDESGNVVTKDGVGVTPGLDATVWLTEVKTSRPHWWPESQGAGARGGSDGKNHGNNPFSHDGWSLTGQGNLIRENPERAAQMAKAVGTTIGGNKPTK